MRGEDVIPTRGTPWQGGSPPHARGRPPGFPTPIDSSRITPACAGKTHRFRRCCFGGGDHPRMRGEDQYGALHQEHEDGSPPHARGRRDFGDRVAPVVVDHPRMRGEDVAWGSRHSWRCGSPPHARGRPEEVFDRSPDGGITPACAGKTTGYTHERRTYCGSPPHARGRRGQFYVRVRPVRITPACAGKTSGGLLRGCLGRDHPRMRGEDSRTPKGRGKSRGSPPHARGRRRRAGSRQTGRWDHPRMRGEDPASAARER